VIPYNSSLTLASLVIVLQIDMLSRYEPLACIDRLASYTGFRERTHPHLIRSPAAEIDECGCNATAPVIWVAEAEVEDW
jgi:hypothetical protein